MAQTTQNKHKRLTFIMVHLTIYHFQLSIKEID